MKTRSVLNALFVLLLSACVPAGFSASAAEPEAGGTHRDKAAAKIDINTAAADQLQGLPGIGPAYAKKIIDNRPYKAVSDLSKAGIPAGTLTKLSDKVTVVRAPRSTTPKNASQPTSKSQPAQPPAADRSSSRSQKSSAPESSDKVWLNTDSNIYHREGSRWYGKTKSGKFVSEQEARAAGARESAE